MRSSMVCTSALSPRWKNMPSLVRSSFTSSPPVWVATVSERAMRGRAAAIRASHSSGERKLPNTTTRGLASCISTCTWRSPAFSRAGESPSKGSGTGTALGSPFCTASSFRCSCSVVSMASAATSSSQPASRMDCSTTGAEKPAWACSMIQRRSSGVMDWAEGLRVLVALCWVGDRAMFKTSNVCRCGQRGRHQSGLRRNTRRSGSDASLSYA